jgi:hypothetical protein
LTTSLSCRNPSFSGDCDDFFDFESSGSEGDLEFFEEMYDESSEEDLDFFRWTLCPRSRLRQAKGLRVGLFLLGVD